MGEQFLSEFYGPPGGDVIDYYVFSLDYKKKEMCFLLQTFFLGHNQKSNGQSLSNSLYQL